MSKLRIGIIGCNGIVKYSHIPAWLALSDEVEIVAVCDIIEERMNIENLLGSSNKLKKYKDYSDMLFDDDIDIIDIATSNNLHTKIAVEALNVGKHVLSEKPDAVSVYEMQRVIKAEKESGKIYMGMRNCRHYDISKFFKKYINDGKCGEFYCGRCGYIRRRGIPGKGGWFTDKSKSGGGALMDLGAHMIDLAVYFMGNPKVVSVSGCTYTKFADSNLSDSINSLFGDKVNDGIFNVEDLAMGFVRFDNGACLQLEFSWASNIEKETNFVELRGTKGGIKFCGTDKNENVIFTEENDTLVDIRPKFEFKSGHFGVMKHFIDVVKGRAEPDYTSEQGLNITKIFEAFYESAKQGKEIYLD